VSAVTPFESLRLAIHEPYLRQASACEITWRQEGRQRRRSSASTSRSPTQSSAFRWSDEEADAFGL